VVGIGLNLRLGEQTKKSIAESGTLAGDLESLGLDAGKRNRVAAAVIGRVITGLQRFAAQGFAPFIDHWRAADVLRDRPIRVLDGGSEREGVARGIDAQGALQIEDAAGRRSAILAGDVSVRT
jgi:BirA family biotin operon repressor/biotin-[acetyl-CoA-carboxylase] ligase